MASKKVENMEGYGGLWAYYGHPDDDYVASASYSYPIVTDNGKDMAGIFVITYHHGEMPAFDSEVFATAEACESRMRELEPDLRKWKQVAA